MSAPDRLGLVLSGVIRREGSLDLQASGDSMFPLIRSGDMCRFVSCEPDRIRVGDVMLYCAESGKLVAHRVHRVLPAEGAGAADSSAARDLAARAASAGQVRKSAAARRLLLLCKGDANAGFDPAVELGQCVGKLLWIRRSGGASAVIVHADRGVAVWWGKLVLAFPLISRLLRRWLDRGGRGGTRLHD